MAKKKSHKKQSFKYAQPTGVSAVESPAATTSAKFPDQTSTNAMILSTNENPFLGQDLRRLGIIAAALILLEFGLWYLFGHTSIGTAVYNLYKIGK